MEFPNPLFRQLGFWWISWDDFWWFPPKKKTRNLSDFQNFPAWPKMTLTFFSFFWGVAPPWGDDFEESGSWVTWHRLAIGPHDMADRAKAEQVDGQFFGNPVPQAMNMWIIEVYYVLFVLFVEPAEVGFFHADFSFSGQLWATTTKSYWGFSGSWQDLIGQRQLVLVSWLFLASFEGLAFVNITVSQHLVSIFSGFTEFC